VKKGSLFINLQHKQVKAGKFQNENKKGSYLNLNCMARVPSAGKNPHINL